MFKFILAFLVGTPSVFANPNHCEEQAESAVVEFIQINRDQESASSPSLVLERLDGVAMNFSSPQEFQFFRERVLKGEIQFYALTAENELLELYQVEFGQENFITCSNPKITVIFHQEDSF